MAIGFAHPEYVSRSAGANACCKSAYNARDKIKDLNSGVIYNWQRRNDNVYHDILLPNHVDKKFKNAAVLANEVERTEKKCNSQLYVEWLLALPKEENVSLELKLEMVNEFIKRKGWINEGLGVQVDIHKPHGDDINWHAHLLVTTRRFTEDGKRLGAKARDLQPEVKYGKVQKTPEIDNNIFWRDVQNDKFKEHGMPNRVDLNGEIAQEHIGPIRMRSVLNEAVIRNEERKFANIESLKTGADVIDRVTKYASIFNVKDLERAVKCIPSHERAANLVLDALNSDQITALYHEGGGESGFYTTAIVRAEELKLIRLGGYMANQKNLMTRDLGVEPSVIAKIINKDESLSNQQQEALSHLTLTGCGIKILKGRAGSGKSHVLGKLASIANYSQINVIALAPTHKAARELAAVGYNKSDTIKGFLFKLYNSKLDLPKNSLIVIDEAGMVGNDDYSEVLRVAAARSCNVILSGDERQLSSIGRGGMFEVFADKFGSYEMNDIRRQESQWSKDIALAFSEGNIRCGIDILKSNNRLNNADTKIDSMESLLNSWNSSSEAVENRLIIAVKNIDVDALNAGARELLKAKNILSGEEILITKDGKNYCFMKNDRIVFNQSNKEIGVSNGDFGIVKSLSSSKFTVTLDNKKEVEFNLSEFSGFKHGYASTVYKAQGSSIRDVYVLHDGFSTNKNSYVAMSRHIKDIHLYTNKVATKTDNHLIKQLGFNPEAGSSLNYYTKEDLEAKRLSESKGVFAKTVDRLSEKLKSGITSFIDKSSVDRDYYVFEKPEVSKAEAFEILELVNEYNESLAKSSSSVADEEALVLEERAVANGYNINQKGGGNNITKSSNNITSKSGNDISAANPNTLSQQSPQFTNTVPRKQNMTPKERFYANRDYLLKKQAANNVDYEQENQNLRQEIKWNAERIALNLLGEPNKRLSDGKQLRFGEQGGVAVMISGEKRGNWYDFEKGTGGDLFDLVRDAKACDFKEAADYLRGVVGIDNKTSNIVNLHDFNDRYVDHHKEKLKEKAEEIASAKKTETLYAKSKAILYTSTAARYLVKTRKIDFAAFQEKIGDDIRTTTIYEPILQKTLPAIVAFARNQDGEITGGQQLLLSSNPLGKANVDTPRKSFGKITGSFVEISSPNRNMQNLQNQLLKDHNTITVIAEGLETALSIQYAGIDAKIICSLGIHNIKNYVPQEGEQIIIAADNDGKDATTNKTIIEASDSLRMSGAIVRIAKPEQVGDFNDILQRSNEGGILEIREIFNPVINSFKAKTLAEFFANFEELDKLTQAARQDLSYISKYTINKDKLLNEFKHSEARGIAELSNTKGAVMYAERSYNNHIQVIEDIRAFGGDVDQKKLIGELSNIATSGHFNYLNELCQDTLHGYISNKRSLLNKEKEQAADPDELLGVVAKEQRLLAGLRKEHKHAIVRYTFKDYKISEAAKISYEQPTLLEDVRKIIVEARQEGSIPNLEIMRTLKSTINIEEIHTNLDKKRENHYIETNLESFKTAKIEAKLPEEMIAIIVKEQSFLADLHETIKYPNEQKHILESIDLAYAQKSDQLVDKLDTLVGRALTSGAKTQDEIIAQLKSEENLKNTCINLDKNLEVHNVQVNLSNFKQQKFESKLPEEIMDILSKEQSFLAELKTNLRYRDVHPHSLLDLVHKACVVKDGNIIPLLKNAVVDTIEIGLKDRDIIVCELKSATDLKSTYINLDKTLEAHHVKSTLDKFAAGKLEARLPEELIGIFTKEQQYLAELNDTIKYHDQHSKDLLDRVAEARLEQQNNIISILGKTVEDIIKTGFKDSSTITYELKNAPDLNSAYFNLDSEFENHSVQTTLNNFSIQKAEAKTLPEILQITAGRQEFLSSLHNTIKYPELQSQTLLDSIAKAHHGEQDNVMQELNSLTAHITEHKIRPEQDLLEQLKNSEDTHATMKELTKSVLEHHASIINKNISSLIDNKHVKIGGKTFDCPMKYLKHEIENPAHAYADIATYKKAIPRLQEIMNKLELKKEHEHSMGGMSM
jgi:Ti-type conjugative transfer relaxase TraA